MKIPRVFLFIALVSCFLQSNVRAQAEKQSEAAHAALALEVTCCQGTRPTFQSVPGVIWYGRFRELEGWKPTADMLPVQAVHIASSMEGAAVRVVVTVDLGKKLFEKREKVGSYLLQENERLKLFDMTAFGLEPFELTAIRVEKKSASVPAVTSNAASVEVREVEAIDSTFPMFKLKLRNTSRKNISALFVDILVNGKLRISAMPHNRDATPLIAAGGTYEYKRQLSSDTRQEGGGYAPEPSPNQTLFIKAAVFDDGTFEGDAEAAVRYRASALGSRTQLAKLVAIYNQALQSAGTDEQAALDSLRRQVNALGTEAAPFEVNRLLEEFSGFTDRAALRVGIEVIMFELKKEALKAIEEFGQRQKTASDGKALRAWLTASRDGYQKQQDRVEKLQGAPPLSLP
jgi:hypothetical protein